MLTHYNTSPSILSYSNSLEIEQKGGCQTNVSVDIYKHCKLLNHIQRNIMQLKDDPALYYHLNECDVVHSYPFLKVDTTYHSVFSSTCNAEPVSHYESITICYSLEHEAFYVSHVTSIEREFSGGSYDDITTLPEHKHLTLEKAIEIANQLYFAIEQKQETL